MLVEFAKMQTRLQLHKKHDDLAKAMAGLIDGAVPAYDGRMKAAEVTSASGRAVGPRSFGCCKVHLRAGWTVPG